MSMRSSMGSLRHDDMLGYIEPADPGVLLDQAIEQHYYAASSVKEVHPPSPCEHLVLVVMC